MAKKKHLAPSKYGLQILLEALGLSSTFSRYEFLSDIVLVSVDCENTGTLRNGFKDCQDSQIGLAILDTRDLHDGEPDEMISTYNFVTGSPSYFEKASKRYLFGESWHIQPNQVLEIIKSVIPQGRNIVLVGFSVTTEMGILSKLGFSLTASISGIVDAALVTNQVKGKWNGKLGRLLKMLKCPHARLHSAGNDANFTLRALLLLAIRGCPDPSCATVEILNQIAQSRAGVEPELQSELDPVKKKKKKAKKELSRKDQAQFWGMHLQDQDRAERAAKKAEREAQEDEGWCLNWLVLEA